MLVGQGFGAEWRGALVVIILVAPGRFGRLLLEEGRKSGEGGVEAGWGGDDGETVAGVEGGVGEAAECGEA